MTFQHIRAWGVPSVGLLSVGLESCSRFVHIGRTEETAMDAALERQIIRLWNQLRLLKREGRPTEAVRRQIEQALAERESRAA
jgi:Iap family predicted aminopeptidase